MAIVSVSLPDNVRDWIRRRVESGDYASESDYLHELIQQDRLALDRLLSVEDIRHSIEKNRAQDNVVSADHVFDRLEAKLKGAAI